MTTNQTIDGVSRELLEAFAAYVADSPNAIMRARAKELRALLDAPTPVSEGVNWKAVANEQMGIIQALKAAQPQGEPVAWMYRREGGECLGQLVQMESDSLKDVREGKVCQGRRVLWPREDYIGWKPLYGKQPAPVEVVLPARDAMSNAYSSCKYHAPHIFEAGWNACLEEVKRLNTNRPVRANPPPGTESSGTHPHNDGLDEMRKPAMCDCNQGRLPCRCRPIPAGIESLAQQIYQSWESQPGFVPWVDGGNSTKQNEARQIASRTFELALANQAEDLP